MPHISSLQQEANEEFLLGDDFERLCVVLEDMGAEEVFPYSGTLFILAQQEIAQRVRNVLVSQQIRVPFTIVQTDQQLIEEVDASQYRLLQLLECRGEGYQLRIFREY